MAQNPISVPPKRLSESITSAATTFKLNNIKGWDGDNLEAADFGDKAYAVFMDEAKTKMEIMEIDESTIASASITIVTRGLSFTGGSSEVTANKLAWTANETIVLIGTNPPQLYEDYVDKFSAETIAGVKTFSSLPATSAGDPVADNDLVRKAYADGLVLGALTTLNLIVPATAGETIADGDLIYFDTVTANEWMKADADTAAKVENVLLGIAQGAGTDGNAISGGVLLEGVDNAQSGMTAGDIMYASDTAGDIANSAGTKEVVVGVAKSATELYFSPRFAQMITEDEQDALAGNLTAPSSANLFVTQAGLQRGLEVYAADAEASDTYVVTLSPVPASLYTGMVIHFKANTANTGAATLNVNGLGAKTIKKHHDQDLATGDIESGQIITVVYDGTNFQMQSQTAQAPVLSVTANQKISVAGGGNVINSTTETNMASVSVGAGVLGTNHAVKVTIYFQQLVAHTTGQTVTFRFKYGTTTLITLTDTDFDTSLLKGKIEFVLRANASATAQSAAALIQASVAGFRTAAVGEYNDYGIGTATENSAGALNIIATVQLGAANASFRMDWDMVIVETIES